MSVKITPGFAAETIDVWETSDLPEADQHMFNSDLEANDAIEVLTITPNDAFGKFKGAYIDSKSVDFSDKLRNDRRKGYSLVWTGEPKKEVETPLKKYQRLNCEVRELLDDIKTAKSSGSEGVSLDKVSLELEKLHRHLVSLRLEEVSGDDGRGHVIRGGDVNSAKLMQQLKNFQASNDVEGKKDKSKKEASNQASYSLYLRSGTGMESNDVLAGLASRLSSLEASLSVKPDQMSMLTMETGKKTLSSAVQVLSSKTSLMDPDKLDHIEGRLGALQQKLGSVQDTKSSLDSERLSKLEQMIAVGERSKPMYDSLPDVIARLESLSGLHASAGQFSNELLQLDSLQTQVTLQMANNHSLLQQTKQKFELNLENINKNFESLFKRIEKVKLASK